MQLDLNLNTPVSVTELTRRLKDTLESGFADVWVQGELTNLRIPSSGHMYFTLKDAGAQVRAVFFRSGNRFLKFRPEEGIEVTIRGRITVYEPRGEYQISVDYMEPKGLGALQLAFIQMRDRLEKEGLFNASRKRPLPPYPKRVGVVTSPTGAAIRDILNVLGRRAPGVQVLIAPASVQGDSAPHEIASAIRDLNEYGGLDVIIAGRGGGSIEDLAAFNTEEVARAIHASSIPVISAVGHETDVTIADFVADLRAPTPSAAAEIVAASEEETRSKIASLGSRLAYSTQRELKYMRARLDSETRAIEDPRRLVQELSQKVDDLAGQLAHANGYIIASLSERARMAARSMAYLSPARELAARRGYASEQLRRLGMAAVNVTNARRGALELVTARLSALQPLAPLSRGFALAYALPEMEHIKCAAGLSVGGRVRLRFVDGQVDCVVEQGPDAESSGLSGEKGGQG